jgi:hypothetical protein
VTIINGFDQKAAIIPHSVIRKRIVIGLSIVFPERITPEAGSSTAPQVIVSLIG